MNRQVIPASISRTGAILKLFETAANVWHCNKRPIANNLTTIELSQMCCRLPGQIMVTNISRVTILTLESLRGYWW